MSDRICIHCLYWKRDDGDPLYGWCGVHDLVMSFDGKCSQFINKENRETEGSGE